jgi:hypothetical protein
VQRSMFHGGKTGEPATLNLNIVQGRLDGIAGKNGC